MRYLAAVDDCFNDTPGGMARVAWDIALLMRDRGHQVFLFCARRAATVPYGSKTDGIDIVRYDKPKLPGWHPQRAERNIQAAAETARRTLCHEKWDVVHMHSVFTGCGVARALGRGSRYIYTMHSPMVLEQRINWASQGWTGRVKLLLGQGKLKRLESELLQQCSGIQTLSEYTRTQIDHFHGLSDRVTVVPHWNRPELKRCYTKEEARKRLGWPADERIFFTLRRHGPRYGLDVAIRAVAPLALQKRCRFVVGGDGPLRPALQRLAAELGVQDRVEFPGRLSDEQLSLAYQAADMFVLPTLALECFGLIILEAFAYGCPVLSSDVCAIPETMRPIMPEFIVPAGQVDVWRNKLDDFLSGTLVPPSPEKLIAYVDEHFSRPKIEPRIAGLLELGASGLAGVH